MRQEKIIGVQKHYIMITVSNFMQFIFISFVAIFILGCDSNKSSISSENDTSFILKESFEGFQTGLFEMEKPFESIGGSSAYIRHEITDNECIEGDKCLKTKSIHLNFDPYYCAYFVMHNIIPDLNQTFYGEFYFKYSYPDTLFSFNMVTSGYFNIVVHESSGMEVSGLGNWTTIVEPGSFKENTWYRVETKIENPEMPVLNIRVYKGNETSPIAGSTFANDISIYKTDYYDDHTYPSRVYAKSEDLLINTPEVDLEPYAWYLDDIRIGIDKNKTLLVGFE
jgi:hypothetical protein